MNAHAFRAKFGCRLFQRFLATRADRDVGLFLREGEGHRTPDTVARTRNNNALSTKSEIHSRLLSKDHRCLPSLLLRGASRWPLHQLEEALSSGSTCSARSIEPFTSAKSTVTCLRSPSRALRELRIFSARCFGVYVRGARAGAAGESAAPQPRQKRISGELDLPHRAHVRSDRSAPPTVATEGGVFGQRSLAGGTVHP